MSKAEGMEGSAVEATLFLGANVVSDGRVLRGNVLTDAQGRIARVELGPQAAVPGGVTGARMVQCEENDFLLPGAIDTHVHFREPGLTHKATLASESAAAVAGGVTSFLDMPNTLPVCDSRERVQEKLALAQGRCYANYGFYLGATMRNADALARAHEWCEVPGVKLFMGTSTGNLAVGDPRRVERVFENVRLPLAVHCEDDATVLRGLAFAKQHHPEGIPFSCHAEIRSEEACVLSVREALGLAQRFGTRLHVLHLSCEGELALIREAKRGWGKELVTCETCAHYLHFSREDYPVKQWRMKCNPSIKQASDRLALQRALRDGTIDTLGTDHAPHTLEEKQRSYSDCPSGLCSIQHSLLVLLAQEAEGSITLPRLVELLSHRPARLFGMEERGYIREGYWADLTLVRRGAEPYLLSDGALYSPCGWSAYDGVSVRDRVVGTWVNGARVYSEAGLGPAAGRALVYSRG